MRLNLRSLLEGFVPPSIVKWGTLQIELSELEISEEELEMDLSYGRDDDAEGTETEAPAAVGGAGAPGVLHAPAR
jgi:hypothetical protein